MQRRERSNFSAAAPSRHFLVNINTWYQWTLDARGTDSPSDLLADQAGPPAALTSWRAYASTPYPFHPELDAFTSTVG